MTAASLQRLRRAERVLLIVAIVATIVAVALAFFTPHAWVTAWRLAVFACLQPALGSMIFILIHRLTGGDWGRGLGPFLLSGARLLPWVWLLVLPLLWFPLVGHPREPPRFGREPAPAALSPTPLRDEANTALERTFSTDARHSDPGLRWYFSRPLLVTRAVVYGIVFALLAWGAPRAMRATVTLRWFGPVGLIGLVFLLHALAVDWFTLLDPGWYSTGFPLVWMAAQAIAGLSLAIAVAVLSGARVQERGRAGHVRGLDWGNLMLAAIMVWAYVAFVQLLIIWSGNLPAETAWYRHRGAGVWRWLGAAVAAIEFGAPFFLLLSRAVKRRPAGLGLVTLLLLAGQLGYTVWLIAPAFPDMTENAPLLLIATVAAALALFANRYLAGARAAAGTLASP